MWKLPADGGGRSDRVGRAWAQIEPLTPARQHRRHRRSQSRILAAHGDNYPRLAALKKRYDPTKMFRLNANIKPA